MGRKSFNWRARQVVETVIDNTTTKKIKHELKVEGNYDQSNELLLPSEKRKTKVKRGQTPNARILTKSQRKKLEKIVERKQKKSNRTALLEALAKVQATPEELNNLTSIASVQTKGLKKFYLEEKFGTKEKRVDREELPSDYVPNSLTGAKRKRLSLLADKPKVNDPNVVGLDESSTDDEEEDVPSDVEAKKPKLDAEPTVADVVIEQPVAVVAPIPSSVERKPAVYVEVDRSSDIQKARMKLPILAEEQQIMETINENDVVIVAGETGSGKTTQVPQFLYEAGYATERMIGITEPRRVAAIAMSKRVAEEMNLSEDVVSYLIRFEGNVKDTTKVKFMTDGVLLKEIQSDFLLTKYTVIILDEAHERSVYTDILIGLLSRIVPLRSKRNNPLKLIVMSATLRLTDFTENERLFKVTPPVLSVDARQFPVTVHFNKRTNDDYMKEAFGKAIKIHTTLPEGGILIFVTGQLEANTLVRKLRKAFPVKRFDTSRQAVATTEAARSDSESDVDDRLTKTLRRKKKNTVKQLPTINLDDYGVVGCEADDSEADDAEAESDADDAQPTIPSGAQPMWVLPLYSLLPSRKQADVFKPPPDGCRLCIVSTNVAETSLTIPNVKYVVDTGRTKAKLYDKVTGVTSYRVDWTSKASANQRAGRAGRVGPGHCYRLYSSAVYNDTFPEYNLPEIQRKPVDDLYLQMKCMNIDKVVNFPFPTAPDLLQLRMAESRLQTLGALQPGGVVTPLGKAISRFPVLPRYGKMLALSHQQNLLPYTICIVAALSVPEVLLETPIVDADEAKQVRAVWVGMRRRWAGVGNSLLLGDPMVLLKAVGAAEYANAGGGLETFCTANGLRHKAVVDIRKLRMQLSNDINVNVPGSTVSVDPMLKPPSDVEAKLLRQILLAGMGDQVAKKVMPEEIPSGEDKNKYKYAYRAMDMEDVVCLHSGSVLKRTLPEYVVYQEVYETNRMYMRGVTAIEPEWLVKYVPHLCKLSAPLLDPEPYYDCNDGEVYCTVTATFGRQAWSIPNAQIVYPKIPDRYKWFARFLLEGRVFERLQKYATKLLSNANTVVKSWAKLQPRTNNFLNALTTNNVSTKAEMENVWKSTPSFLLEEYLNWVPESARSDVLLLWPPVDL